MKHNFYNIRKRRGKNKEFQKAMIVTLMTKNYNVSPDALDLNSLIDTKLSPPENWALIKPKVLLLSKKTLRACT